MELTYILWLLLILGLAYLQCRFPKSSVVKWIRILVAILKSLF